MSTPRKWSWRAPLSAGVFSLIGVSAVFFVACFGLCFGFPCFPLGLRYGMWIDQCPAGDLRLGARVDVSGVVRGGEGTVSVLPYARFLRGSGSAVWVDEATLYRGVFTRIELLDSEGKPVEGMVNKGGSKRYGWWDMVVALPDVPDGDYVLRASIDAPFEDVEVDVDLPLYAPAIAHAMTDRPLYRPGQEVLLRSVTFRRTNLSPLDQRPGKWRVIDPNGEEMLVEKGRAGAYGVAASSFPLDDRAQIGTWKAIWETGAARDEVAFDVRPFRLPRFTVEAAASEPWFGRADKVRIKGSASYTSGAPVADAPVEVTLRLAEGRWPIPVEWEDPFTARTGRDGKFEIEVGQVPSDLIERNVVTASVRVTEAAGEVAMGGARIVLSEDDLQVEAVTELGNGLVGGFNNRLYIRVSSPDGRPLPLSDVVVTNPWDTRAPKRDARTDEDGVAALQIDPGDPVTVVIPAAPVRVRPMVPDDPRLTSGSEVTWGRSLEMAERRALDTASPAIARCGDLSLGGEEVALGVRVSESGAVADVLTAPGALPRCVADAMRAVRFPPGPTRTFALVWRVPDSLVPSFPVDLRPAYGSDAGVGAAWRDAAREARRCTRRNEGVSGATMITAHWRVREGSTAIASDMEVSAWGTGLDATQTACVSRAFTGARLADEASGDAMGVVRVTISVPQPPGVYSPGPTTTTGYEVAVMASSDGAEIGETRLVLPVGYVPPLRIRATPSLAYPGDTVVFEMYRGPDYYGDLPEKAWLMAGSLSVGEAEIDEDARTATFTIPEDRAGFLHLDVGGARAVVFVRPKNPLSVSVTSDRPAYEPGQTATLTVTTRAGDQPTPAGVGLVGVDSALAQLAPLLGPDDYGRVTVRATADAPAFDAFDPRALALGQVRGENAAKAAVLRISQLPTDPGGDERLYKSGASIHDDTEVLITSFYALLEDLHHKVRAWELSAPAGEVMTPDRMVKLWDEVLAEREGEPATDAFGRPLTLDLLPSDLLAQVDPRQVVQDGTRLPEDVVSWERYVAEEVGR